MGYVGNAPYQGVVNEGNIADNAVTTPKIAPDTVVAADIAPGAVGSSEIADTAVTNAKIDTVAATKLTGTVSTARLPAGTVIQTQYNVMTVSYTGNSSSYVQVTAFNQTFTPLYSTSKVYVTFNTGINLICDGSVALTRNGSIIKDTWFGSSRQDDQYDYPQASGFYLDSPGTTSTVTYGIQVRATGCSNIIRIGGSDNHQSWTFMEIAQ